MSLDFKAVEPQYRQLKALVSQIPGTCEARVSNKRLIICCLDKGIAYRLCSEIRSMGFASHVEKGLNTSRYYVATSFNYPY